MKKKVLIPVDFSKNAWNAITYAMNLFKGEHCEFYILNTFYLGGFSNENLLIAKPSDSAYEAIKKTSEEKMDKLKTQIEFRDDSPGHRFHFHCEFGPLTDVIKRFIRKKDIEFMVMGTRGETDSKDLIFGSNTINMMENIQACPVLAVPGNVAFKEPNEIVFPTNFKTYYKRRELYYLIDIAKLTHAPIRILHIQQKDKLSEKQKDNKALLEDIFENVEFSHHTMEKMDVKKGLHKFVESRNSDMIAFINRKHTFFGSIFSNPMVRELGVYATVPVLAMRDIL
ncbi:universal stress protein [Marixanthomonas spongiae]|uniref:Universal stress protein n=1 Tax=Marixanthomonas spongiae TaxID=2174845 RepID=A0A2U0I433_9FLAO|nr:universal stress protein [Marixanthomonas spongiae]PVW15873.1 universal stress protein [Marixanthomonas spongiae]